MNRIYAMTPCCLQMKDGKYSLEGSLKSAEAMFGDNPDNLAIAKDVAQKCQAEGM